MSRAGTGRGSGCGERGARRGEDVCFPPPHPTTRTAPLTKRSPPLWPSPPVGSGGSVGAMVAVFLERSVGNAGLVLILLTAGLFGLALCHDVLLAWPVQEARDWLRARSARGGAGGVV